MPDRDHEIREITERILDGEARIAEQQKLIVKLEHAGQDTTGARELLSVLEGSQFLLESRRSMLHRRS